MTARITIERAGERVFRVTLVADIQIVADPRALGFGGALKEDGRSADAAAAGQQAVGAPGAAFLTVEEAAEVLHISRDMVYHLLRTGQLRSIKIGKLRRISRDWITEFTESLGTARM